MIAIMRQCHMDLSSWFIYDHLQKHDMLVILETQCDPSKLKKAFSIMGFDGYLATEVNGYPVRIVIVWREDYMFLP